MKKFLELHEEQNKTHKPVVMAFGRMNPPTSGHLKLIDKVKSTAEKEGAKHTVILSHSQDAKKNPLTGEQKLKHARRYSPGTHFEVASKEHPTLMHHAARLHAAGHDHLIVVGGSDRVKEYHDLLHKYNGVHGKHGHYNFKKIEVRSAGHRDPDSEGTEGVSGTKMRHHAQNNDFHSFRQGVPHHVSDHHARELMRDVRKGMGMNENVNRGLFKAIFVTGGPGSGKDIIIRECIAESKAAELNTIQAFDGLIKNAYIKEVKDRKPLIINGPAEDIDRIAIVKEYLENLGYSTMMIFVETANEASKQRNKKLSRMMVESVRQDKWNQAQKNKVVFSESFDNFMVFENNGTLDSLEEDITDTYQTINNFLDNKNHTKTAMFWLEGHNKLNINDKFNYFLKENKNVEKDSKLVQKLNIRGKYNPFFRAQSPADANPDNRKLDTEIDQIQGNIRPRKDPNGKGHSGGAWSGAYNTEEKNPTLKINQPPKEPNFQKDNDKEKVKKRGDKSLSAARLNNPDGVGSTWNTRTNGSGLTGGAGLGDQSFRESVTSNDDVINFGAQPKGVVVNPLQNEKDFKKLRKTIKEWNGFQNDDAGMGVGGTLGGSTNKEPMQSYKDSERNIGITIKKKKKVEKMFDKKIKSIADAVNTVLGLNKEEIDPKVRTKDTAKGQEPTKQKDDVGPGSDGKSTKVKYRGGPLATSEDFKQRLLNHIEEANEDMLARYMKSRGYNPETTPKDKKIAITKSNEFKKWLNDHQFESAEYDGEDYSDEELNEMINEVLSKDAKAGDWIHDFVHSDNPKFKGKSKEKRKKMALAAYYAHQREEIELSEEQLDETPVTKAKAPYRPGSIDPATGKTREAPKGTYAYDKAQREKNKVNEEEDHLKETSGFVTTTRGEDKKGRFTATLIRKVGEHKPEEVSRKYDKDLEEAKRPETDNVPFEAPYSDVKPDVKDKGTGGTHTPMSRARHLARMALKKVKNEMLGKAGMTSEEAESLDEKIDHDTLNDIIKTHGFTKASKAIQKVYNDGHISKKQADKHMSYLNSHPDKVGQAKYAVEEVEQIDELSNDTLKSYIKKAKTDYSKPATNPDGVRNIQPREKGIWKALGKLKKEETEQIDEISGELASRYLQKKHDRDYEKTGPYTSRRKEPQTMDQAFKDGRNTARALKRIGPLSKIGKKAK